MIIVYGSSTGNCEEAAKLIASQFEPKPELVSASSATADDLKEHDLCIIGSSTWGIGEIQDDMPNFLETISPNSLKGKRVAIFGTGDGVSFSESFVDAIGEIYDCFSSAGADIIGSVPADGYEFSESTAFRDGKFVGLPLDYDNAGGEVENQVKKWCTQLKDVK